jgi:hypothetical protein
MEPAASFARYCCGGTRATFLPNDTLGVRIYYSDPGANANESFLDEVIVPASESTWTISSRVVVAADQIAGVNAAPELGWTYAAVCVFLTNVNVRVGHNLLSPVYYTAPGGQFSVGAAIDIDIDT